MLSTSEGDGLHKSPEVGQVPAESTHQMHALDDIVALQNWFSENVEFLVIKSKSHMKISVEQVMRVVGSNMMPRFEIM